MTKIPEREECYIKPFPIADEQSIRETRQNLELVKVITSFPLNLANLRYGRLRHTIDFDFNIFPLLKNVKERLSITLHGFCSCLPLLFYEPIAIIYSIQPTEESRQHIQGA